MSYNSFYDITPLNNLKQLKNLYLTGDWYDITPLSSLTNLETLYINETPLDDIRALSNLKNLKEGSISKTDWLGGFEVLSNLPNLSILDISYKDLCQNNIDV